MGNMATTQTICRLTSASKKPISDWANLGASLLNLHLGFESVAPYPLARIDLDAPAGRALLRADKERGVILIDERTTLEGVPADAWRYVLGSRSALEWVLDQHKHRKPRDPIVAARFNEYLFAEHKERVIDLLCRICAVSVRTMGIMDEICALEKTAQRA